MAQQPAVQEQPSVVDEPKTAPYTIEVQGVDVVLDATTVTANDVKNEQFATSYTTGKYDSPGSLTANHFEIKNGELLWITLAVSVPAKNSQNKNEMDPTNSYKGVPK
eukprot:36820_1